VLDDTPETNMKTITLDIHPNGDVHCLYTDDVDLFALGIVTDIHKASNVEFNEAEQTWEVLSLEGKVLHTNPNREKAIDWEIEAFSPGGTHYEKRTL